METTTTNTDVVVIKDLHKDYYLGGEVITALDGVSLTVPSGAFVAIMGASGSGKTTLMHLIGGLDLPTQGAITVNEKAVDRLTDQERTLFRRRHLGIVFQTFNLLPTLTALENVMLPLLVDGRSAADARRRAEELLKTVNLEHRLKHRPDLMSGGEQQRVAIARALANHPRLILADEPTGNLDSKTGRELMGLLQRLIRDEGLTLLLVTHDMNVARYADRIVHLLDGQIQYIEVGVEEFDKVT